MQRAHIVQTIRQLDQQHADIFGHGEQKLAQVFCRPLVFWHRFDLGQLGHAIHQPRDFGPEIKLNIFNRRQRILDRIMQQSGHDGFLVKLKIGHQSGNLDRMAEIGITAGALLRPVFLNGVDIGAVQRGLVGLRVIF